MAPSKTSSMLGWVAAVIETESPSQPKPAVIQMMWISATAGFFWVTRPYGTACAVIADTPFNIAYVRVSVMSPEESRIQTSTRPHARQTRRHDSRLDMQFQDADGS